MKTNFIFFMLLFVLFMERFTNATELSSSSESKFVKTGLDNIAEYVHLLTGKRIGIITNHTAYNFENQHIIDVFTKNLKLQVTALFGPEHGIRGDEAAGEMIDSTLDPVQSIPIYSLYGQVRKPTPEMLKNVDILIFDIQDIGARFYTYIYTMSLAMEAAAEHHIPFFVLDRPNPINGIQVEGNILEPQFATFVGLYPIPIRHGMTVGELATLINEEKWLKNNVKAELKVIPLKNWQRSRWFDQTGLKFIKPSPNMPDLDTATIYPGLCLIEGTNISEGRGTLTPFVIFGAPWIDANFLCNQLNELKLAGIKFEPAVFTPQAIPEMAPDPKYKNEKCHGCRVIVLDREQLQAYWMGIQIVKTIYDLYPDNFEWRIQHFDRLCGSASIREAIINHLDLNELKVVWNMELNKFLKIRNQYILYNLN
ncbi:DUF1343 domain-containing protein [candidate division KSB1 bacterium]|nr:DUF1343 domain-containing protein [candidate division KSB1 bacterium]